MLAHVKDEVDLALQFFRENEGSVVKDESTLIVITGNHTRIPFDVRDLVGLGGDNLFANIMAGFINVEEHVVRALSAAIARLEDDAPDYAKMDGFVIVFKTVDRETGHKVIIEGHDREGGLESWSVICEPRAENRFLVQRIEENEPDKSYLQHGAWPWQGPI